MTEERRVALATELDRLNAEVKTAIAKRERWMDAHMPDYAKYQVGEAIYDMRSGARLGVVSRLYRYWGGRDPQYDVSMVIDYEFKTPQGFYDNTSRHAGGLWIGTAQELTAYHESQARVARLRGPDGGIEWAKVFHVERSGSKEGD